jgi:hypothetical protein
MKSDAADTGWQMRLWQAILSCAAAEGAGIADRYGFGYLNALKLATPVWDDHGITLQYWLDFQAAGMERNRRSIELWLFKIFDLDLCIRVKKEALCKP